MFLLFLLILLSCHRDDKMKAYKNFSNQINEDILLTHPFDKKEIIERSDFLTVFYPDAIDAHEFAGVIFGRSFTDSEFMMELEQINKDFTKVYLSDSICHKIIPYGIAQEECLELKLIPNVNDTLLLPKDYIIGESMYYIIGYKKGEWLSPAYSNYYAKNTKDYHGYTTGVIANIAAKSLVYWLLIE